MITEATTSTPNDSARFSRNVTSARRSRLVLGILAVIVPLVLFTLFHRQEQRLRALADHGMTTTAVVDRVFRQNGVTYADYRYEIEGASYSWSVGHEQAPFAAGVSFPITYLPEDPSFSRPGPHFSMDALQAELRPGIRLGIPFGALVFLGGFAAWSHVVLQRLRRTGTLPPPRKVDPVLVGKVLATLLLVVGLATNLADDVHAVHVKLFGEHPLGLPVMLVVTLVEAVLFIPYFWVFPHLMRIVLNTKRAAGAWERGRS